MADGVENAAVVCCFMTQKYQNSRNCEKELLYAERRRVPIIPCRMTRGWEPSTWLGLVIAGSVWIDFRESSDANLDLRINNLIEQIRIVAGRKLTCFPPGTSNFCQSSISTFSLPFHLDLSNSSLHALYPILPATSEKSSDTEIDASFDAPKRVTVLAMTQRQPSVERTQIAASTPPPVPPRPDKALILERLLQADAKRDLPKSKENRESSVPSTPMILASTPLNSAQPDVCEVPLQQHAISSTIPVRITLNLVTFILAHRRYLGCFGRAIYFAQ